MALSFGICVFLHASCSSYLLYEGPEARVLKLQRRSVWCSYVATVLYCRFSVRWGFFFFFLRWCFVSMAIWMAVWMAFFFDDGFRRRLGAAGNECLRARSKGHKGWMDTL